jgi:hypothetical protein
MLRSIAFVAGLILTASAGCAVASSPDAWRELRARSDLACMAVSGLSKAKIAGYADGFQSVAVSIVVGVYPRNHSSGKHVVGKPDKGVKGRVLCVFDKRTGKAEAQEPGE